MFADGFVFYCTVSELIYFIQNQVSNIPILKELWEKKQNTIG